jgi:branched-chain amino acid transport system permease protein
VSRRSIWALALLVGLPIAVFSVWALVDNPRLYLVTLLNSLTLASLYFIVASGFTLVFGLMRNVNLAHGSLYLLGGYVAFIVA